MALNIEMTNKKKPLKQLQRKENYGGMNEGKLATTNALRKAAT